MFGLVFPLVFLNGWLILVLCRYLEPIPSTLVTAGLIAFLLDYPIAFLEQRGVKRGWAIGLVLLLALVLLGVLGLVLGPLVFEQLVEFGNRLPAWVDEASRHLQTLDEQPFLQQLPVDISEITTQLTNQLYGTLKVLTSQLINVTLDTISSALNLFLTLVLTIFLVLNGKQLWDGIFSWFPALWRPRLQISLKQSFQGYFAGQATIAAALSVVLLVAFLTLQIPFGLLFSLVIGTASLIPFGGVVSITLVSVILAFQNVWLAVKVLIVAVVIGQINENVIAPRLLSGITGLNPAWVVVSLLIGARLGGILGLLIAVPTASFIKRTVDTLRNSGTDELRAIADVETNTDSEIRPLAN